MQTSADKALADAKQHILAARDLLRAATHPNTDGSDEFKSEYTKGVIHIEQYLTWALTEHL